MPRGTVRETIPASCAEVFGLVHDYGRRLEWDTLLEAAYLCGCGEARRGAVAVCTGRAGLGGLTLVTRYVSHRPPAVAAVKMINRPAFFDSFAAVIRHRDLGSGMSSIEYTYRFTSRPRWLRFVLHPLMNWWLARETRRRLRALRNYLRRQGPRATAPA